MLRLSARVLVVAGLVTLGWVVGHAQQAPTAGDFELKVTVNNGGAALTCIRGCVLTWGPRMVSPNGQFEVHVPAQTVSGYNTPDGCVAGQFVQGSCRIFGWKQ
ncbi:MAG: hypothetical protein ABI634_10835 [Acidobacteriota bacterium]